MSAPYGFGIPASHPALPGHFPGHPVVPGVVLLDLAALHLADTLGLAPGQLRLGTAKFLYPVAPGDFVVLQYTPPTDATLRFTLRVGEHDVANGVFNIAPAAAPAGADAP